MKNPVDVIKAKKQVSDYKINQLNEQILEAANEVEILKEKEQRALDKADAKALKEATARRVDLESSIDAWSRIRDNMGAGYTSDDVMETWAKFAAEFNADIADDIDELNKKYDELYKAFINVFRKQNIATAYKYQLADLIPDDGSVYEKISMLGMQLKLMNHPEIAKAFEDYITRDFGTWTNANTFIEATADEAWVSDIK